MSAPCDRDSVTGTVTHRDAERDGSLFSREEVLASD